MVNRTTTFIVENRIQPVVLGVCEIVVSAILFILVFLEMLGGQTDSSAKGLIASGLMLLAATLHFSSIKFFRIEIDGSTIKVRSWQTLFRTRTVSIQELDPVKFDSDGPAYTPLLVLSYHRRKLARVSAFCTNADMLESVLKSYGKWRNE